MADVEDHDRVLLDREEKCIGIPHNRNAPDTGPAFHLLAATWLAAKIHC